MAKVTGIGGVFFKSKTDRKALADWYRTHLGVQVESYGGAVFRWADDRAADSGATAWHIADAGSKWFQPSEASFMINYRVDDLDQMLDGLRAGGVQVVGGPDADENGKFAWILDPDGNKVELWEPAISVDKKTGA
jgi:predicted enzyme related to lactoylglutathione lyase